MDKAPSVKGCQHCIASKLKQYAIPVPIMNRTMNGLRTSCGGKALQSITIAVLAVTKNNLATINNTADQQLISGIGVVTVTSKAIEMG